MKKEFIEYLQIFRSNGRYDYIQDIKLQDALYLFSAYVSEMYFNEMLENISSELKELKAHTIFIYLGSIIEAVVYYYISTKLKEKSGKSKYLKSDIYTPVQKIKHTDNLYICKQSEKILDFHTSINFQSLILGAKDKKLLPNSIIQKIDYFRKMRNLVHINALLSHSLEQTFKELDSAFGKAKEVFDHIEADLYDSKQ